MELYGPVSLRPVNHCKNHKSLNDYPKLEKCVIGILRRDEFSWRKSYLKSLAYNVHSVTFTFIFICCNYIMHYINIKSKE